MLSLPVFLNPPSLPPSPSPLPPCPSHGRRRTFGETLRTCLFAFLSSSFAKKPRPPSPDEMFYSRPFKAKQEIQDGVGCRLFPRTFATAENVIYQPGCVPPLGNVMVLTVLWRRSCLSLVVGKWEELDYHKSELSMTQLHTSLWNRFTATQSFSDDYWIFVADALFIYLKVLCFSSEI